MTNGGTPEAWDRSNYQRVQPLTLTFGGLRGAGPGLIMVGASGVFTGVLIGAVASGQLLWVTIPLMIIFAIVFLASIPGVRRGATRHGLTLDQSGVHTTLRGEESSFIPWGDIAAVAITYDMIKSGESGRKTPGMYGIDLFCTVPRENVSPEQGPPGIPLRVDYGYTPSFGIPEGHVHITLPSTDESRRQEVIDFIRGLGVTQILDKFERPRESHRSS